VTETRTIYIGGSAIRFSDLGTVALPLPADHGDVRQLVTEIHGTRAGKHHGEVGYVTGQGKFVRPREALLIAQQARQLRSRIVRSEDLQATNLLAPSARGYVPRLARQKVGRASVNAVVTRDQLRRDLRRTAEYAVPAAIAAGSLSFYFASAFLYPMWSATAGVPAFHWSAVIAQLLMSALGGIGLALVIHARGSTYRGATVASYAGLLALSCLCGAALNDGLFVLGVMLLGMMFPLALIAIGLFGRIRLLAGLLLLPHLGWLLLLAYAI
jgi:hypothetical protein